MLRDHRVAIVGAPAVIGSLLADWARLPRAQAFSLTLLVAAVFAAYGVLHRRRSTRAPQQEGRA